MQYRGRNERVFLVSRRSWTVVSGDSEKQLTTAVLTAKVRILLLMLAAQQEEI